MWSGWRFGILVGSMWVLCSWESAGAQLFQSSGSSFQTQGTRRGAVVGGIIGGVIGARNDRPVAGIVAGSVVGGLLGREVGRQRDTQFFQQQAFYPGYGHPYGAARTWRSTTVFPDPRFQPIPTYRGTVVRQQQFYGPRQYFVPPQQPRAIRYGW
jgi:hypothetical protein